MHEAEIAATESGRRPSGDGWFILNLVEIGWETVPGGGTWCVFEAPSAPSRKLGIGVHVLNPGDGPCAILMVGTRSADHKIHYPVDPVAAAHQTSVEVATDSPSVAYAGRPPIGPARSPWSAGETG